MKIKVFSHSRFNIQELIDDWLKDHPDIVYKDFKPGGFNRHGDAICYLLYEEGIKL